MAALQQILKARRVTVAAINQSFVKRLQLVSQVTDGGDLGHPRAALERMQITLQGGQNVLVVRLCQPALQGLTGAFENIDGFLEEDLDHLLIQSLERENLLHGRGLFRLAGGELKRF